MKILCVGLVLASLLTIGLKLFTFEFFLADDPTTGVAARLRPGFDNRQSFHDSSNMGDNIILLSDENDFPGGDLYRLLVSGGWLGVVLITVGVLTVARLKTQRQDNSRARPL